MWTQHKTQHRLRRQIENQGQTAAHSPPPAAHLPSRKSTPHYTLLAILHQPGEGASTLLLGLGQRRVGRGSSMHKEALGGFNQSLATTGGLGAWAVAF